MELLYIISTNTPNRCLRPRNLPISNLPVKVWKAWLADAIGSGEKDA